MAQSLVGDQSSECVPGLIPMSILFNFFINDLNVWTECALRKFKGDTNEARVI